MVQFLSNFFFEDGVMVVAQGQEPTDHRFIDRPVNFAADTSVFFGPALREMPGGLDKDDVIGTRALWVDVDNPDVPDPTLPPNALVWSGHGWHVYWFLDDILGEVSEIEALNQALAKDIPTADPSCWNANRYLRVPNTTNLKFPAAPVKVELRHYDDSFRYRVDEVATVVNLDPRIRNRIRTGEGRGFRSRSERDWSVVVALIEAGAQDDLIAHMFEKCAIGDKMRDPKTAANYLEHTIARARVQHKAKTPRERKQAAPKEPTKKRQPKGEEDDGPRIMFVEKGDGYYVTGRMERRVSTFVIDPKVLLDGTQFEAEDAIVGEVKAGDYSWPNVTFPRASFTTVNKMDRATPTAAWQWLGNDSDVRLLLPHLLEKLKNAGLPKVAASPTQGLHYIKGVPYFLGDRQVLSADSLWTGYDGPIAWLPTGKEHPSMDLQPVESGLDLSLLRDNVLKLNTPDVIWPMVGWYASCCIKPWLATKGYRFPVLNVTGTRGSGKTTLIQRIFMPLFGQKDPKSYDAGTTKFVTLALLGSSNAIPIAFSEFRYESVQGFLRYVLLSYDTGHDPRGRADQTTVDYPLAAPFTIDGEDLIADPAAQERIIVAQLHPATVAEGTSPHVAFRALRDYLPAGFAGTYYRQVLKKVVDGEMEEMLRQASIAVLKAFPSRLPDRVRNNHIVVYLGACLFADFIGVARPDARAALGTSIQTIVNLDTGRSRTLADEFIESVTNGVASREARFKYKYDPNLCVLWFQMAPAHDWWLTWRRRQARGSLERDAIKQQLKEASYMVDGRAVDGIWMVGVNLQKAQDFGLDVPSVMNIQQMVIDF